MVALAAAAALALAILSLCLICAMESFFLADVERLEQLVETFARDMDNWSEQQLNALWQRAQKEVDEQIMQARKRNQQ